MPRTAMIRPRRGTLAEWATAEVGGPALAPGEIALVDGSFVLGDGVKKAADLAPAGSTAFASRYASAATAATTARFLSKLKRGTQDLSLLVIGDSTGNETTEWVYLAVQDLAAQFPTHTVTYALWDAAGGTAYSAPQTLQTGSGTRTLRVWNASIAGSAPDYVNGFRYQAAVAATAPDLVFVSHGHNTGDPGTTEGQWWNSFRNAYLSMIEPVSSQFPAAGVVLIAQNPSFVAGRESWQAQKASILADLAGQRGFGFIDVHQAFMDAVAAAGGSAAFRATYMSDATHPNSLAQSTIWAPAVISALKASAVTGAGVSGQSVSPVLQGARNLIPNSDFAAWSGSAPDGWVLTGCTATKDTTLFETGTYSCRLDAPASAGTMQMEYSVNLATLGPKGLLDGAPATLAARIYIPAANATIPSVIMKDQGGSGTAGRADASPANSYGRWVWLFCTRRFASPANVLAVDLFPRVSGTAAGTVYVDRVYLTVGDLPRCGG